MSDDQEDVDDVEAEPERDAPEAPEGQPGIGEDRSADLDGIEIDADDLEPEADDDQEDDVDVGAEPETSDVDDLGVVESGEWGDMYVALLTSTTNSVIEKHGDDGAEVDEEHFRSIDLDRHFSKTMEKYAGGSEMPPEQALVVGTLIAVGGPVALHTDLLSDMKEELRE